MPGSGTAATREKQVKGEEEEEEEVELEGKLDALKVEEEEKIEEEEKSTASASTTKTTSANAKKDAVEGHNAAVASATKKVAPTTQQTSKIVDKAASSTAPSTSVRKEDGLVDSTHDVKVVLAKEDRPIHNNQKGLNQAGGSQNDMGQDEEYHLANGEEGGEGAGGEEDSPTNRDQPDLYQSVSSFEELGLNAELLKGVYSLGFQKPSKIQANALPLLLKDPPKNMIAQSQAGTGKTACFSLNVLSRVDPNLPQVQAICLAPARELARQILDNIRELGKYTKVVSVLCVPQSIGRGAMIEGQVVVGTPGTIMDLCKRKQLDTRGVKVFVLDEADNMLDQQGLGDTSLRIKNLMPKGCQIVLFSATYTEQVRQYAQKVAPNAHSLALPQQEVSVDSIKQFYMDCRDTNHKAETLCAIYGLLTIGQSIIFVRERRTADMLHGRMVEEGHAVSSLHGNFEANDRDTAIDNFREGKSKVLITTNVLARGIDILQVNLVINYDIPVDKEGRADPETYVHRIGRTGRFGRTGVSINFVHDRQSYEEMLEIQNFMGREIVRVPADNFQDVERILKSAIHN